MRKISFGAIALVLALSGCNQPAGQTPDTPQQGGSGYGPFDVGSGQNGPPQDSPFMGGGGADTGGGEAILAGGGANAPQQFQSLVIGYLDNYAAQLAAGWPRVNAVPDTVTGLEANGEHRLQVRLLGGRSYAFIGACDNECSNLDFILEDASGRVVGSDVLPDDYPLIEISPPANAAYTLRIQLKTCSIGPCYVAARLVARPQS